MMKPFDHAAAVSRPRHYGVLAALVGALVTGMAMPVSAQERGLSGSWNGNGTLMLPSGDSEKARCRVSYSQTTITRYKARAVCATSSARVEQTATLRRVGDNRYVGTFYNSEYGVSGSISVVLRGRVQSVSLNGENGARASIRLSR